jgi:hypothetical protein
MLLNSLLKKAKELEENLNRELSGTKSNRTLSRQSSRDDISTKTGSAHTPALKKSQSLPHVSDGDGTPPASSQMAQQPDSRKLS